MTGPSQAQQKQTAPAFAEPAVLEAQRAQKARDAILSSPYLTVDGNVLKVIKPASGPSAAIGYASQAATQNQQGFLRSLTQYKDPDPAPGPPPQSEEQANFHPYIGIIDPTLVEAQKVDDKRITGMIDPALIDAQEAHNKQLTNNLSKQNPQTMRIGGAADPALLEAEKWNQFLHPELYPDKGDAVDITPGDDGWDNPYGIDVNAFLRWAYSQLGYHEKASNADLNNKTANNGGSNWTKYGEWYGLNGGDKAPWCAMFASWCAMMAGVPEYLIKKTASTGDFINWYKEQNRFEPKGLDYDPKAGDLILYQWYEENEAGKGYYDLIDGKYVYNANKTGEYDKLGHT